MRRRGTPNWGVFLNEEEQGGGPLIDIGTHSLDLTLWMMNNYKPKMVVGTKYKKLPNPDCANPWGGWDVNQHTVEDSVWLYCHGRWRDDHPKDELVPEHHRARP